MAITAAAIMAGGSLLGGMMGGSGGGSIHQPGFLKASLKPYGKTLQGFGDMYNPQFFPGQTYASQSPFSQIAIDQLGGFSTQPSQNYMQDVLAGNYLGLNPAMQAAVMNPAIQASNASFNALGRFGSGANQARTQQAAMEAMMPYYNQERQRQQQAAQLLPGLQELQANLNLQGGQLDEYYRQQPITEDMQRWQFEQNQPLTRMQGWGSLYGPITGNATAFNQANTGGSTLSGILGGGLMGANIANQFGLLGNQNPGLLSQGLTQPNYTQGVSGVNPYTFNQWGVY